MRKIVVILTCIVLCSGCSVSRRQNRAFIGNVSQFGKESVDQSLINQNITNQSFYIEKAEFKIESDGGEKTGIASLKFLKPDKFLVSIKSNIGIEISRIYLAGDSVFINDRLGKRLFWGSTSYLREKYGLTTSVLPVILGDYVNDKQIGEGVTRCEDGKLNVKAVIKDVRIDYVVDCIYRKNILATPEKYRNSIGLNIKYGNFIRKDKLNIPGTITISEKENKTKIEIKIIRIISPWEGTIDFIPGKQYEKIHLQ